MKQCFFPGILLTLVCVGGCSSSSKPIVVDIADVPIDGKIDPETGRRIPGTNTLSFRSFASISPPGPGRTQVTSVVSGVVDERTGEFWSHEPVAGSSEAFENVFWGGTGQAAVGSLIQGVGGVFWGSHIPAAKTTIRMNNGNTIGPITNTAKGGAGGGGGQGGAGGRGVVERGAVNVNDHVAVGVHNQVSSRNTNSNHNQNQNANLNHNNNQNHNNNVVWSSNTNNNQANAGSSSYSNAGQSQGQSQGQGQGINPPPPPWHSN